MKKFLTTIALLAGVMTVSAQPQEAPVRMTQELYISLVAPIAIEQMQLYGIPASITVAQGIVESGFGTSRLAKEANNHFGIKCRSTWEGKQFYMTDDAPDECFRVYLSVEESYVDHSLFLRGNERYASLFKLDSTDYEGWANGLKAAGYATSPSYARQLIEKIETFGLNRLDEGYIPAEYQITYTHPTLALVDQYGTLRRTGKPYGQETSRQAQTQRPQAQTQPQQVAQPQLQPQPQQASTTQAQQPQQVRYNTQPQGDGLLHYTVGRMDGRRYITAKRGDTYTLLARMVGISEQKLREYNGLQESTLREGDVVFLQRPRTVH